jgi:hypothetical protein
LLFDGLQLKALKLTLTMREFEIDQQKQLVTARSRGSYFRAFKKYPSVQICRAIEEIEHESRREWMLNIFRVAASETGKHTDGIFSEVGGL